MHDLLARTGSATRLRRLRTVLKSQHHVHLGAERLAVELNGLLAAPIEKQIRLNHRNIASHSCFLNECFVFTHTTNRKRALGQFFRKSYPDGSRSELLKKTDNIAVLSFTQPLDGKRAIRAAAMIVLACLTV